MARGRLTAVAAAALFGLATSIIAGQGQGQGRGGQAPGGQAPGGQGRGGQPAANAPPVGADPTLAQGQGRGGRRSSGASCDQRTTEDRRASSEIANGCTVTLCRSFCRYRRRR